MENNEIMNDIEMNEGNEGVTVYDLEATNEDSTTSPAAAFVLGGATVLIGGKLIKFLHRKVVKPIANKLRGKKKKSKAVIENVEYVEVDGAEENVEADE